MEEGDSFETGLLKIAYNSSLALQRFYQASLPFQGSGLHSREGLFVIIFKDE
jgi:hypothetical protein